MAPVWITDRNGVVLAGGARTQGLPSFGMQDGDEIDGVRPELGVLLFNSAARGSVTAELRAEPGAAAQVASLETQILEELRGFTASMETALQPWILAWEDQGWLGAAKAWFAGAKRGISTWWEGETDFWAAVRDWMSNLPDMLGDAWDGLSSGARALWDNKDRIVQLLQDFATGSVKAFQRGIEALKNALAEIPGLEEIAETFRLLVEKSAEWAGAMNEMVIQSPRILTALGATMLGVVMLTTPNFWAEMIGTGTGFLLPEIILAIIFAIIAFFTVGTGGAALAARLTAFVARVTGQLTQLGHAAGRVILRMFQGIASIAGKMRDLIRAQKRNRAEKAQGTTDSDTAIVREIRTKVPLNRKPFHRQDLDETWYRPEDGELRWPPNDGFATQAVDDKLTRGQMIDRYSGLTGVDDGGNFLSPQGASFESRALPYDPDRMQYSIYEVMEDIPVKSGTAAPWFDQVGGAQQFMTEESVGDLVKKGVLRMVGP